MKNSHKKGKRDKTAQIIDYTFDYIPGDTFFYKLHPVNKILWFVLITYIVLIQESLIILSVLFGTVCLTAIFSKIKLKDIIKRLKWIIWLLVFSIVINIFFNAIPDSQAEVLFYIWKPQIPVRRLAVYYALRMGLWVLSLSSTGVIFMNTTSPKDIVYGMRKLGFPYKFALSFMVGLRYIPLIQSSTNTVVLAQKARGLDRENAKSFKRTLEMIKDRLTTSLIIIFRNADSTALSMELRAFGVNKKRTDVYSIKFENYDVLFIIILVSFSVLISLYRFGALSFLPPIPSLYGLFWS